MDLRVLFVGLADHRDLLSLLLVWEIGKPWRLACADVDRALDGVRWYLENIDRQLEGRVPLPGPVSNIASWNYPMSVQVHAELVQLLADQLKKQPPAGPAAAAVQARGGDIIGIIPEFLTEREHMFTGAHELVITRDMHERKRIMFERSDAFVALPGGIGTLEEMVEQLTWAQLGRHRKPILLANLKGFWDSLIDVFTHMGRIGFVHSAATLNYVITDNVEDILPALRAAAARVSEDEKAGEPETVRRL